MAYILNDEVADLISDCKDKKEALSYVRDFASIYGFTEDEVNKEVELVYAKRLDEAIKVLMQTTAPSVAENFAESISEEIGVELDIVRLKIKKALEK